MFTQRLLWVCPLARSSWRSIRQLDSICSCIIYQHRTLSRSSVFNTFQLSRTNRTVSRLSLLEGAHTLPQCVQRTLAGASDAPMGRSYSTSSNQCSCCQKVEQYSWSGLVSQNRNISGVCLSVGTAGCVKYRTPIAAGVSYTTGRGYCTFPEDENRTEDLKETLEEESRNEGLQKIEGEEDNSNVEEESEGNANDEVKEEFQEAREFMEMQREKGAPVPTSIDDDKLEYLAQLSKKKRKGYLHHLFKKELKKKENAEKRQQKLAELETESEAKPHRTWNTMQRKIGRRDFDELNGWRLSAAMKFNPQLVFDCIYEEFMTWQDIRSLISQFGLLYSVNAMANEPFFIRLVNYNQDGLIAREMKRLYKHQMDNLMVDFNRKSLLDVYAHEDLLYMSPDSDKIMTSYDPNKVYVIGALVDKGRQEVGASLSQAKQLGIAHCRLPLDAYFHWSQGAHKNMTLDSMANIFVELNTHNDMGKALQKSVPQRKQDGLKFDLNNKNVQDVLLRTIGDERLLSNLKKRPPAKNTHQKRSPKSNLYTSGDRNPYAFSRARHRPHGDDNSASKFDPEWQSGVRRSRTFDRTSNFNQSRRPLKFESEDNEGCVSNFSHAKHSLTWEDDESNDRTSRINREKRAREWNTQDDDDRGSKYSRAKVSKKWKLDEE